MKISFKAAVLMLLIATLGMLAPSGVTEAAQVQIAVTVPSTVSSGAAFTVTVQVTNKKTTSITFNKVAAGYVLPDLKIKGPYEVSTTSRTVAANSTSTFTFPFSINYTKGAVIPLTVMIVNNAYNKDGILAGDIVGVNISPQ